MLGGMAGGGMALLVDPDQRPTIDQQWPDLLAEVAERHREQLPFVMQPTCCRVALNRVGSVATLLEGQAAHPSMAYYHLHIPRLAAIDRDSRQAYRRDDALQLLEDQSIDTGQRQQLLQGLLHRLLPQANQDQSIAAELHAERDRWGFDGERQARVIAAIQRGDCSLVRNRLPSHAVIEPATQIDVLGQPSRTDADSSSDLPSENYHQGDEALQAGTVAMVTLAGGVGSRWSGGGGVVKALHPFTELPSLGSSQTSSLTPSMTPSWHSFLSVHLTQAQRIAEAYACSMPLVFTTSFLTDGPVGRALQGSTCQNILDASSDIEHGATVFRSLCMTVAQRLVPHPRDLRSWLQQQAMSCLDEQAEKARRDRDAAWLAWAEEHEGPSPYQDNVVQQCLNPPGHWWELPSLIANGTLLRLLTDNPSVQTLFVRNLDTLGAVPDAASLAAHLQHRQRGAVMTTEVIERYDGDMGGSLAMVDGVPRLIEGLAIPDEAQELALPYYNSNTCWISVDGLLQWFGLSRSDLADQSRCRQAVLSQSRRLPIYVTIKEVQKRWGLGQVDVFPVAQCEQLWGDMTTQPNFPTDYLLVPRQRGQQLKDMAQLLPWQRDGSAEMIASLMS